MKRFIRIGSVVLLTLVAGGMLTWYLLMRRSIPGHARCIPKNAIAVLTLNTRELALDHSGDEHLFPGLDDKSSIPGDLQTLLRAVDANDGSGIRETADVLGFFYQDGDAAFLGVSLSVKDSKKFSTLILDRLSKNYPLEKIPANGCTLVRFDSTSAALGWNDEIALFLYPFSNHGGEDVARQCAKLLAQTPGASILTDENFRTHELASFDAGLWLHTDPFLYFTGGGSLFRTALNGTEYVSLNIDFREGETDVRRIVTDKSGYEAQFAPAITQLPCDPKQVLGFLKLPLDLRNQTIVNQHIEAPPLNQLPFSDTELDEMVKHFDGSCLVLVHDTISYEMPYIGYTYDEEFNQVADTLYKRETTSAMTYCFGLGAGDAWMKKYLTGLLGNAGIPQRNGEWIFEENGLESRLFVSGNLLVYTSNPACDGQLRPLPPAWQSQEMRLATGDYVGKSGLLEFFLKDLGGTHALLGEHLGEFTIMNSLTTGNVHASDVRLQMKNSEIDALVQLEDIFRKGLRE